MSKRILFISDHGDPLAPLGGDQAGGQNNYVRQLALALDQLGHTVDVFTHWANPHTPRVEYFGTNCRVFRIAAGQKGFVDKSEMYHLLPAFFNEMTSLHFLPQYDIMHTHYWLSGLLGARISKQFNIPWVHTSHSLGSAKQQVTGVEETRRLQAEKMILQSTDRTIATTETELKLIESFVKKPSKVSVISIGVDDFFKPSTSTIVNPLTFTFAGRIEETKGIYSLIKAFKLLKASGLVQRPIRLRIIGGDDTQVDATTKRAVSSTLQKAVLGVEEDIEFLGSKPPRELAKYFNRSLAVIVPSYYESFGMVAAEAQSCGVPVIASKVGGLGDIVIHKKTGLQTRVGSVKELAASMGLLVNRPDIATRLGKQAAIYAQAHFDWSVIVQKVVSLYDEVETSVEDSFISN